MALRFELPTMKRKQAAIDFIKEFLQHDSSINGTGGLDIIDYESWLTGCLSSHKGIIIRKDRVPASTYFVINEDDIIIGMVNIRHALSDYLITSGSGHIGYSVRPTQRRKGYATVILKKALEILKNDFKVEEALLGCYSDNIGSMKTILNNGGVLDRKIEEGTKTTHAYKIKLG